MASRALRLDKGRVLVFCLQRCFHFRVAGKAQIGVFLDEKMVVLGGMRQMAGKASPVAGNGRVNCCPFLLLVGMTAETERIHSGIQELRILR